MLACHNLRMHSPLKKVLNKLRDSYQTYIDIYKTHTMTTCHGGICQPLEMDPNPQVQDIDIPNDYQEDIDVFENVEHENHVWLKELRNELDHLQHKVEASENQPTDTINCLEHELHRLSLVLCPSAPPEPLDEVLQQYAETLCTTQKRTTFTSTLLKDITIFNGNDSTQLEDWLIDIETTADLTSESRTKLAQAKSKGLTHMLISEALNLDKSWDEIKDLLHLKIHNSGIHTSASHFMEVQQNEKESLAAYIHRFKWEAKRCNFYNNAATIWIFVKGLNNAHTLESHVYEKGP